MSDRTTGHLPDRDQGRRFSRMDKRESAIKKRNVLEALADGASIHDAAWGAGTNATTVTRWRDEDEQFDQACGEAMDTGRLGEYGEEESE